MQNYCILLTSAVIAGSLLSCFVDGQTVAPVEVKQYTGSFVNYNRQWRETLRNKESNAFDNAAKYYRKALQKLLTEIGVSGIEVTHFRPSETNENPVVNFRYSATSDIQADVRSKLETKWPQRSIGQNNDRSKPSIKEAQPNGTTDDGNEQLEEVELGAAVTIDCFPDRHNQNEAACLARGCLWKKQTDESRLPSCKFRDTNDEKFAGYDVTAVSSDGATFELTRRDTPSLYGEDSQRINVQFTYMSSYALRVRLYDPTQTDRYHVPEEAVKVQVENDNENVKYGVEYTRSPFGFRVYRRKSDQTLFDSRMVPGMAVANQFLQLSGRIAGPNMYGLGEHVRDTLQLPIDWRNWTMFARDAAPIGPPHNLYGHHPFYLNLEGNDGDAHGLLLLNSNAVEVLLQPTPPAITYRAIGGMLDLFFFLGDMPDQVVQRYVSAIGKPALPPYWALGYQLCRWGYKNADEVFTLTRAMREKGYPQDVQYADIDYMHEKLPFTYDGKRWKTLPDLVKELHDNHQKFMLIVDPGIATKAWYMFDETSNQTYHAYVDGMDMDIFIKDVEGHPFVGSVWPGEVHYPDFTNPKTVDYYAKQITKLMADVPFDGLWIDMNEPSNFNDGPAGRYENKYFKSCHYNRFNWSPYLPTVLEYQKAGLVGKTICMDAKQHWGKHYDVHNLYGHSMAQTANRALKMANPGKRPFVLTRSTFIGTGKYATHWLGDNEASYANLRQSIIGALDMNMFGMPFVGADICGFNGNTTDELCNRWSMIGAFYPFSRNHNSIGQISQDPIHMKTGDQTARAMGARLSWLPYLYTQLYLSHTTGSTVARPMFYEFPDDKLTWNLGSQYLVGPNFLVAGVMEPNSAEMSVYIPKGRWYRLGLLDGKPAREMENGWQNLTMELGDIFLGTRGGFIIPLQLNSTNTYLTSKNNFRLFIGLDENLYALGHLFLDDGESDISPETHNLFDIELKTTALGAGSESRLMFTAVRQAYQMPNKWDRITVAGLRSQPNNLTLTPNDRPFEYEWSMVNKELTITTELPMDRITDYTITWINLPHKTTVSNKENKAEDNN